MRITYYYHSDCFRFGRVLCILTTAAIVMVFDISLLVIDCKFKILFTKHRLLVCSEKRQRGSDLKPSIAYTRWLVSISIANAHVIHKVSPNENEQCIYIYNTKKNCYEKNYKWKGILSYSCFMEVRRFIYILYYTGISSHYSSTYVLRCCNSFTTNVCHIEYQSRSVMMMETVSFFDSI
jgi:hypothetical protein